MLNDIERKISLINQAFQRKDNFIFVNLNKVENDEDLYLGCADTWGNET